MAWSDCRACGWYRVEARGSISNQIISSVFHSWGVLQKAWRKEVSYSEPVSGDD